MILVAGGEADPNLQSLLATLEATATRHIALLVGPNRDPKVHWDVDADTLDVDGVRVAPTGVFLRYDVFSQLGEGRAAAWYTTMQGWAAAHRGVGFLNRDALPAQKPQQLVAAREAGLAIPRTWITNDLGALDALDAERFIAKPVAGGDLARPLGPLLKAAPRRNGAAASPAIVQERLVAPELRVYRIANRFLAFDVASPSLDYREHQDAVVTPTAMPRALAAPLRRLMDALRMDFGAADFKTSTGTNRYCFLEVNSGPMFAAFDAVSNAAISKAIISALS